MKKILLLMMCCPVALSAQTGSNNGVTVSSLAVEPGTVTFNVSWNDEHSEDFLWSDSVWVFVEYNNAGKMERLPLSGATLTAPSWAAASITLKDGNDQGAWIIGNARTESSFSTTVQLLTTTADLAGVCAYASNYPPVGEYTDASQIKFTGTSMYKIVLEEIAGEGILTDYSDGLYTVRPGYTVKSFTDATGAPGKMKCILPDNPTGTPNSRCGEGEITISAASPSTNTVVDWYDVEIGGAVLSGGSATDAFTPIIASSTTYYAQARDTITHCVSAARTPVVATVNIIPTPTLSSGTASASQTVDWNTPIADIIYTAANATIALSSGSSSLPDGVSGTSTVDASGSTFTISGTPAVAGTFNYTVTATHVDGGCTSTLSGIITVLSNTPPYAISASTWQIGNLTWSDRINVNLPACSLVSSSSKDVTAPEYAVTNDTYYYSWTCIAITQQVICPDPWHVPTLTEYQDLMNRLTTNEFLAKWPAKGYVYSALSYTDGSYQWSSTSCGSSSNNSIEVGRLGTYCHAWSIMMPIFCVK